MTDEPKFTADMVRAQVEKLREQRRRPGDPCLCIVCMWYRRNHNV